MYRHSTAHLLAAAVLELFPETKLGIGPPIDTGFYYDFQRDAPFSPEDLEKIEKRMWEIQARDLPYERKYTEKNEGLKLYADQPMKVELITERAGDIFSEYTLGPQFIDFCRGPHVPSTKKIKAFKLLSIAGAYWKGDETERAAPAHLRHGVLQQEGTGRVSGQARRSQEARPSQAGPGAGSVQHPGAGRSRADLLSPQGRHHSQADRRLDARPVSEARLFAGVHAARDARRSVAHVRAPEPLSRRICSRAWSWMTPSIG